VNVTVVWATPFVQDVVDVELPEGATIAEAVSKSGLVARYALDPAILGFAIHGRRAGGTLPLAEGDRVELTRPLQADPKVARARRAGTKPLPKQTRRTKPPRMA
jgi:putative ubiquitin-RnfH superfamily antitoxin RatB of RatAB toxin-antitoxin module